MSLRSWILGFDPLALLQELDHIKKRLDNVEAKLRTIEEELKKKSDKRELELLEREVLQVENVNKMLMEEYKALSEAVKALLITEPENVENVSDLEARVINLLRQKERSPRELLKILKIGSKSLYEVLAKLKKEGKVRTKKVGRKVYYYLIEA